MLHQQCGIVVIPLTYLKHFSANAFLLILAALTDLSNLDADGYFQGEDLMPNTTPKPDVKLIFYNRVPKCGSRSVMSVIDKMGQQNGFKWISSDIFNQAHLDPPRRVSVTLTFCQIPFMRFVGFFVF